MVCNTFEGKQYFSLNLSIFLCFKIINSNFFNLTSDFGAGIYCTVSNVTLLVIQSSFFYCYAFFRSGAINFISLNGHCSINSLCSYSCYSGLSRTFGIISVGINGTNDFNISSISKSSPIFNSNVVTVIDHYYGYQMINSINSSNNLIGLRYSGHMSLYSNNEIIQFSTFINNFAGESSCIQSGNLIIFYLINSNVINNSQGTNLKGTVSVSPSIINNCIFLLNLENNFGLLFYGSNITINNCFIDKCNISCPTILNPLITYHITTFSLNHNKNCPWIEFSKQNIRLYFTIIHKFKLLFLFFELT